jgi:hypothetical protein
VDVPLQVLPAPYRERGGPLLAEVQRLHDQGVELVSVVVCTLGPRWWQRPLYLADTAKIRAALARCASTAVVDHRMSLLSPHTPAIGTGAAAVAGKPR